ncbi:unnamed protein product [Zymoseptoria tritici ST99CH_1A5]|uniref:HpcH/HpaI aldolase/citrate lyase domain-containing protein n=1 Tax=Zymoseptoria tritici ST99CH_1A5 TaxID=1276529 RepID=A0A1Y6M2A7_ZYMTR|nr:unnamed protein product [Zymoseptoria tritici ST99CH_1A5]
MEHSSFDLDTTGQLCIAALYAGITLIVRAASKEPYFVSRNLDGGALGVIVPHIKTVQDARDVVAAAKFQPVGHRSSTNGLPHFQFQSVTAKVANPIVNTNTLVNPMIETLEALGIGARRRDCRCQYDDPRLLAAYERVIAACKKHGVWLGCKGLHARLDLVEKFCSLGVDWVMAATDGPLLLSGATKRAGEMASLSARSRATNGLTNGLGNTTAPSALAEKLNGVKVAVVEQLS